MTPTGSSGRAPSLRAELRHLAVWISIATTAFLVAVGVLRTLTIEPAPSIHVEWRVGLSDARRQDLERQFALTNPEPTPPSWAYELLDTTRGNVEAIVTHPDVVDTGDLDRNEFDVAGTAPYGDGDTWVVYRLPGVRRPAVVTAAVSTAGALLAGSLFVIRFTTE